MAYIVIKHFVDLQDNNYVYSVGNTFPRAGVTVSDERIAELSGSDNRQGVPLIKLLEDDKEAEQADEVKETPDEVKEAEADAAETAADEVAAEEKADEVKETPKKTRKKKTTEE